MNDLVSIIMPSFNTGKFIAESISSVLNQTYQNWELLIVDDCSSDDTESVISNISDNRIKFFKNQKNCGAALSRNRAIKEARGKWVAFLDSDDIWDSRKLEKQVSFMEKNKHVFSYTDYERIDEESKNIGIYCSGPTIITKRKMYHYCYPGCLTVMYDSDFFGLIQIEDIKKNNDYAIWLCLCKKANCYLLNENLAKYRIRKKSISHDKISKKLKSHYLLFRVCERKPPLAAFWFAFWNLWFGFLKKIKFEKKFINE